MHSGESGTGKTETTKFIVAHVIDLCKAGRKKSLESNVEQLNPLLEAFGNARTGPLPSFGVVYARSQAIIDMC